MGKRFRKSFTFDGKRYFVDGKTQKEADEKAIEKRTELENHVRKVTEPKSISQWMNGWIDTYKSHVSLKNQKQQQHILECFRDFTGDERMDRIKQRDIQRFINQTD